LTNLWLLAVAAISYLLGSLPVAYLIAKWAGGRTLWLQGTGNVGTMNVYRATGSSVLGLLTLAGDMGKAALAIVAVHALDTGLDPRLVLVTAAFFVVLGHSYSVFLRFRGGRGLASIAGVLLALDWFTPFVAIGTLSITILAVEYLFKRKLDWNLRGVLSVLGSQLLGRVIGMAVCLIPLYFLEPRTLYVLPAILLAFVRHIDRLRAYLSGLSTSLGR